MDSASPRALWRSAEDTPIPQNSAIFWYRGPYKSVSRETLLSARPKPYKAQDSGLAFERVRLIDLPAQFEKGGGGAPMSRLLPERIPGVKARFKSLALVLRIPRSGRLAQTLGLPFPQHEGLGSKQAFEAVLSRRGPVSSVIRV
jgi:hypothetical protein